MSLRFFPILIPLALLCLSFWRAGLYEDYHQAKEIQAQRVASEARLVELQAIDVASRIDEQKYQGLVSDFAEITGLELDSEYAVSKGEVSAQLARFVQAVTLGLRQDRFAPTDRGHYLLFRSVTPGTRHVVEPFLWVDFELNLEGRFFALPAFLSLLSEIAQEQRCTISVGELKVARIDSNQNSGRLYITLPLRAYFLEK